MIRSRFSRVTNCTGGLCSCTCKVLTTFLACLFFYLIYYILVVLNKGLEPVCEKVYDRTCNDQGVCNKGICYCYTPYSGSACSDTLGPGYDIVSNTECNGNGQINPFFTPSDECFQGVVDGIRVGTGWTGTTCREYVKGVQTLLQQRNYDSTGVPGAFRIPVCKCDTPWGGTACNVKQPLTDENGLICSGHGNTSVGFFGNYTNDGVGAQCLLPLALYDARVTVLFNQDQMDLIYSTYYNFFTQLSCGVLQNATIAGVTYIYIWQPGGFSYGCYCTGNWKGPICNENKCPANTQTKAICNGQGDPYSGQGRNVNSTKAVKNDGTPCDLNCSPGYSLCGNRCAYVQEVPLFDEGTYCNNLQEATAEQPIRCYDGTLVEMYPDQGCNYGFRTGTIDPSQVGITAAQWVCANVTSGVLLQECLFNTTEIPGVLGYLPSGGIIWDSNYNLTVNLQSPIQYVFFIPFLTTLMWARRIHKFKQDNFNYKKVS